MDPNAVIETFRRTVAEHYVDFQGRTARREFWYYILAYFVAYIVLAIVQSLFGSRLLTGLYSLGLLLPGLGIAVRRLHDTGRSGWWLLIGVVPGFLLAIMAAAALMGGATKSGFLYTILLPIIALGTLALLIYWYAQPGDPGDNQFGPAPVEGTPPVTT